MLKIVNAISKWMAIKLDLDDEKKDVIAYGMFAFFQSIFCILLVIIVGFIFHVLVEAVIISFSIAILRKSSGGIHASTPGICAIVGTLVPIICSLIIKNINITLYVVIFFGVIAFLISYMLVYKLAPVDSIKKPIKNTKKRLKLKRKSIITISVYLVLVILNLIAYYIWESYDLMVYSLCICSGMLWQVFTLTKIGHLLLSKVDDFLSNIISYEACEKR
ncbi:accessory gene regulator ArgB-like protein [Clostridium senegalense]|uniref:Accessory gene regulator B family protein n=1 Tax=Clostridium senegalense TaxID=1465809 RepID=A0A6M0H139_9CLOT|nr:accessory gene regulator B family protein [Clostridium senegalense]NEU04207.1 accessory gene regulator B family protein [Clostridium senegalense]